jgi:SAM-dependent methyltransferase
MHECQKSVQRRLYDPAFHQFYFVGDGIDIGGGYDGLDNYAKLFPRIRSVRNWDVKDGDAQLMAGVPDALYDFVHSSHCLEHMRDPYEALKNWWRILKPGGHLVVMVPDEDLYEQGVWPSTFNGDHKRTFTIWKGEAGSWSDASIGVLYLIMALGSNAKPLSIRLLESTFIRGIQRCDQTQAAGECAIEFIVRKLP